MNPCPTTNNFSHSPRYVHVLICPCFCLLSHVRRQSSADPREHLVPGRAVQGAEEVRARGATLSGGLEEAHRAVREAARRDAEVTQQSRGALQRAEEIQSGRYVCGRLYIY